MLRFYFAIFFSLSFAALYSQAAFIDGSQSSNFVMEGYNSGVAIGDYNNDGLEDIYITVRQGKNKLYRNLGDHNYVEVAESAGIDYSAKGRSSIWGDLDNDGDLDLYVGNFNSPDLLFRNNGDGSFTDVSQLAGIQNIGWPLSVNMADVNQDGLLDIYVSNSTQENVLYRNNGHLSFTNVISTSGAMDPSISMGSIFFDYDNDGDQDLYLVHDSYRANILYQNTGTGFFVNVTATAGVGYEGLGMGVDVGDINHDGYLDLYITNLFENVLYLNNGNGTFTDISQYCDVEDRGMGWGTNFLDYNNDGFIDIYVTNDSYHSPFPNVLYKNKGDLIFDKMDTDDPVLSELGGLGSATVDLNRDGKLEIIVANSGRNDYPQLFKNEMSESGHWIAFKLEGVQSNRSAVGARIMLTTKSGKLLIREISAGSGYVSQNSLIQHFGLGTETEFENIEIRWPNGLLQNVDPLETDLFYKIKEGSEPEIFDLGGTSSNEELSFNQSFISSLSPNPAIDFIDFVFSVEHALDVDLEIVNLQGQKVYSQKHNHINAGVIRVPLSPDLSNGVYLLRLKTEIGMTIRRFVISR